MQHILVRYGTVPYDTFVPYSNTANVLLMIYLRFKEMDKIKNWDCKLDVTV